MYDENSFKNYIFWLQVKRFFLMFVFSIVGAFIGILLSQFFIDVLLVLTSNFKPVIIALSTLLFFGISLLLTAGTGKDVQEGYWKMAVLRKLTVISKKLDYLENFGDEPIRKKEIVKHIAKEINDEIKIENNKIDDNIENPYNANISDSTKEFQEKEYEKKDFAGNLVPTTNNSIKNKKNSKKNSSKKASSTKISKLAKK